MTKAPNPWIGQGGTTLRDLFAAFAISDTLSRVPPSGENLRVVAEDAYRLADAMLEARRK